MKALVLRFHPQRPRAARTKAPEPSAHDVLLARLRTVLEIHPGAFHVLDRLAGDLLGDP
jgi:hypothetical protein